MTETAVAPTNRAHINGRPLSGREKVAVLCMAVGAEHAAKLTSWLNAEEAELISFEIAQMERVPQDVMEQVLSEWLESTLGIASLTTGGMDYAREVLEKAFGRQRADSILRRIQSQMADTAGLYRL